MRDRARAVVIGGGVGGASVLYWLTRLGWEDVLLVERADLTSGSTFHSAGLVGQLRGSLSLTRMMMNSVDLYRTLSDEVGLETGWHEVGSLRLASSQERMEELSRQAGWAKTFGLPLELISAEEAQKLFPPMSTDGVLGAAYLPTDGYIDPSQLTFALAEGARRGGAEIATHTRVTAVGVELGRVTGIETDKGPVEAEVVVNAGGMFAGEIGSLADVNVPVIPMAHEYLITKPSGVPLDVPTMRDPSLLVYFRGESGGLVMGGYERNPAPWALDGIPPDFNGQLLEEDWERFEELMTNAIVRVPELEEAEVVKLVNGPEAFTPDGEFILGESDVRGFWVAAGFCAHGLAGAGGMGQARRRVDRRGRPEPGRLGDGLAPLRRGLPQPGVHARAHRRGLLDLLRRQVPGPRAARRAGRCASRRPTSACRSSARPSARSPAGSERTGSSRTPSAGTSRCGRAAGPDASGRRRSGPSTAPAARRPRCSTRRRSPSSTWPGRGRPVSWSRSAPTASRATSEPSPTRRC